VDIGFRLGAKMIRPIVFLALLGVALAFGDCEQSSAEEKPRIAALPEKDTKDKEDSLEAIRSYANKKREEYREKAEELLRSYEKQFNELKAKAESARGEAKKKFAEAEAALRAKQKELRKQLDEFKTASAKAWEEMEKKIDAGLAELKTRYEKARAALANRKPA
jgi:phage-related protein